MTIEGIEGLEDIAQALDPSGVFAEPAYKQSMVRTLAGEMRRQPIRRDDGDMDDSLSIAFHSDQHHQVDAQTGSVRFGTDVPHARFYEDELPHADPDIVANTIADHLFKDLDNLGEG